MVTRCAGWRGLAAAIVSGQSSSGFRRSAAVPRLNSWRELCSKAQESKSPPGTASQQMTKSEPPAYKLPGYKPSNFDKKILLWSGHFKKAEDIPQFISFEKIDAARNRIRVKASYGMILVTVLVCVVTVIAGKQAVGRNESLTMLNVERKGRGKEGMEKERDSAVAASKPL
ncbi:protein FAM162B [Latimeria chalumnae]|uniref:Family with sequence similarity 162 member A n=1 Tax=Latimeria chalumnae TaxID=7897 RepID=H3AB12_LATCH|nr:PREDICTED: protein FAM162B-like [Latimeria chalumnae]|eukprot:XP_006007813.1 PREDICTED: protein FAM162B-like [Latimeria chalumnae]